MKKKNHDRVSQLRIKIWIYVVMNIGRFKNGYETQKHITPEKFVHKDNGTNYPKKYSKYINYKFAPFPNDKTLKITEMNFPESRHWFDMPLWEAITTKIESEKDLESLVHKLNEVDIYEYLLSECATINNFVVATEITGKQIEQIKFFEAPDTLSALVILLMKAEFANHKNHKDKLLYELLNLLISCLVVFGLNVDFIQLYYICKLRFSTNWGGKMFLEEVEKMEISENMKLDIYNKAKVRKAIIDIARSANFSRANLQTFILLDRYSKLEPGILKKHMNLFFNNREQFEEEAVKFLIPIFKRK